MKKFDYSGHDFGDLPKKRPLILVDIDGTIADGRHRMKFIEQTPKDWESFFAEAKNDARIKPVIRLVNTLLWGKSYGVVFITGRPESIREDTLKWLNDTFKPLEIPTQRLVMRQVGDHRPDDNVKYEMLADLRHQGYKPTLAIEDRTRVVKMYRSANLTCLQCADGDF